MQHLVAEEPSSFRVATASVAEEPSSSSRVATVRQASSSFEVVSLVAERT